MYTAIAIWSVVFIVVLWRFKKIYDKRLKDLQKNWVEFINTMCGEMDARITSDHDEIKKLKDGR